jgi:glycosyltransferase involved in cell wall biosynthesis
MSPRSKVRVLFVNDTARNGGPGRSLHSVLKFLDPAAIHRCVLLPRSGAISDLVSRDGVADEVRFDPDLVENPIEPLSRPMLRHDYEAPAALRWARAAANSARVARAVSRLARAVRHDRFDLIYCNGSSADFLGGIVAARTGVPALWHVRYTGLPPVVRPLHRRLSTSAAVRRIVCVSRAATSLFEHCAAKVAVIHNALDVDAFDPLSIRGSLREELDLPLDAVVFGSHGRVLRRKGYVEMIEAARLALDAMTPQGRDRVHFVVVGDTPEDFAEDHVATCRDAVRRAGLGERFRFLGFRADVRPLVADFDVAVVPSVYRDPLPRSVIESMALGKPVVAFDVGGIAEMIQDNVDGQLVPFEVDAAGTGASRASVGRLASAIVTYAVDPDRRRRQGAAARSRVLRSFDARDHSRAIQAEIMASCQLGAD